ncbi:unnamed protein product [Effrenium voratum]|uniref:Uncharacterized protein n=1 Tax=Effrenium voratum TaxID=2562239 RepID=A0AA36J878_9DINO|nr:unnamed protein product [Effrenium voratum]CAJ1443720.1 unnamed protein product [Effrenium voratum]CAJ1446215.1 unnamed protein product [Effrenium voratum]
MEDEEEEEEEDLEEEEEEEDQQNEEQEEEDKDQGENDETDSESGSEDGEGEGEEAEGDQREGDQDEGDQGEKDDPDSDESEQDEGDMDESDQDDADQDEDDRTNAASKSKSKNKSKSRSDSNKKDKGKALRGAEKHLKRNSSTHRKEYMAFGRWCKNKRRFPSKLVAELKSEDGRDRLFQEYLDCGGDTNEVVVRASRRLEETQRTKLKYGFRNQQWLNTHHGEKRAQKIMQRKKALGLTIGDPEFPDDPEERLYFVMVELNIEDVRELKRVTEMELSGTLDKDGVKAFVEGGGCLDGKSHLAIGDMVSAGGMNKLMASMGGPVKKPKKMGENKGGPKPDQTSQASHKRESDSMCR